MKKILCTFLIFIMLAGLVGCAPGTKATDLTKNMSADSVTEKPITDSFEDSHANFSVQLLQHAASQHSNKNILVSPLSAMLALSMTANGADGDTKTEMEQVLGTGLTIEELNEHLYTYTKNLPSDQKYQLHIANSIWIKEDDNFKVEDSFLETNATYYNAQIYNAAFDKTTVKDINDWVAYHTNDMIDKIVEEINKDTLMYLINALSFEAEWANIYKDTQIRKADFTSYDGTKNRIDVMVGSEYAYLDGGDAVGFLKDYKNGSYQFAALLPNEDVDLYEYIKTLDYKKLMQILQNASTESVSTIIPKFSYDFSMSLNDSLEAMGMPTAFDAQNADFTNLGSHPNNIYISEVLQKTFITVDEKGTKAGAVTSVANDAAGEAMKPKEVWLTRPFVYMIIDTENKLPIFIGAVLEL